MFQKCNLQLHNRNDTLKLPTSECSHSKGWYLLNLLLAFSLNRKLTNYYFIFSH